MSTKKNIPVKKNEPVPSPKKINIITLGENQEFLSTVLNLTQENKLYDAELYSFTSQGIKKISKNQIEPGLNPESTVPEKHFTIFLDSRSINAIPDLKVWLGIKGLQSLPVAQKLLYKTGLLNSFISNSSILVNKEFVSELSSSYTNDIAPEALGSTLFSSFQAIKAVKINSAPEYQTPGMWTTFKNIVRSSTVEAWNNIKKWPLQKESRVIEHPVWRFMLACIMVLGLIYLLLGGLHAGIGGDEFRYINQSEKVVKFYSTFGADTTAYTRAGVDPQHFNGQLLDNAMYVIGKPLGLERNFKFRHSITAFFSWIAILCTVFSALVLFNARIAFLTSLFIFLCPIFIGNGFNNHRDMPLVTGIMMAILGLSLLRNTFPYLNKKYLLLILLGVFISFGQRIAGGIMAGFLLVLFSVIILLEQKQFSKLIALDKSILAWVGGMAIATLIGIVLSFLVWPYGLIDPFKHAYEVYTQSGNLSVALFQIFEAKYKLSSQMPDHYVLKYMGITIPVATLAGVLIIISFLFKKSIPYPKFILAFILIAFLFPVLYSYFKLGNMYGSWRHFMFTFPFIAMASALGWDIFLNSYIRPNHVLLPAGILLILLIHPLQYIVRNHPFEYMYYNEIIGGNRGAFGKYEWDYSLNSIKQGSEWLKKYIRQHHPKGTKLVIASNGGELSKYFEGFDDSITTIYTRYYERSNQNWDYAVFPNMYIHPHQLKNGIYPRADSLHFIKIDGKPVTFIYKRNNKVDFAASQAITRQDIPTAIQELNTYLKYNPKSEWAWFQLAYMYAQQNNFPQCQTYLNEAFKWHPEFLPALALQGLLYQNTGRCNDAQPIFLRLINEAKYDLFNTYKWSGMCYETDKNYKKALEQYGFALGAGNTQKDTYAKIANCFRQLGDQNQAAKYEALAK